MRTNFHYSLEFSEEQWDELISLTFEPFEFRAGESLTRVQWMALGEMCLGKAQRIDEGVYGPDDEEVDVVVWAEELRDIAAVIFDKFKPGDGQL